MRRFGLIVIASACSPPMTIQDSLIADRDLGDVSAIRAHGWELWAELASGEVWNTWACFNRWLEARFPGGLASNCVTCHQRAVVGAADYLPVTHGWLRADDPYFHGHLATDFLWSVTFEAR